MSPDLAQIRLLLADVDGVLTDGRIWFDAQAGVETKAFHVHDAAGIVYWIRSGGLMGFLSGRESAVAEMRARELGVHEVHLGYLHKLPVFEDILKRHDLTPAQVAYVGDDILDLPIMQRAGYAVAPADSRPDIQSVAHHVSDRRGGFGVVRDTIEQLMRAQGSWSKVLEGVHTL